MRNLIPLTAALVLLCAGSVFAQAKAAPKVTILFTGDNGGEVAPCG